jgi:hypothetical protein
MIISDIRAKKSKSKYSLIWVPLLLLLALLIILWKPRLWRSSVAEQDTYYCDAESVKGDKFISGGNEFGGGKNQSDKYARNGKYACNLTIAADNQYGFAFDLPSWNPGETYKASVWRYRPKGGNEGFLVVAAEGDGAFYKSTKNILKQVDGWDYLEITFRIPYYQAVDKVSIYVYSSGSIPLFFDDLRISKTSEPINLATAPWTPDTIQLSLNKKALQKLEVKRSNALRQGLLETGEEDWVNAKVGSPANEKKVNAKVRLKGDWLDHLKGNKWSFRIKTKNGEAFNRMRVFSVHTPEARNFLHEWVLHRFFEKEDILSTYYDFALVELNADQLGVYAVEEHFDKVLLERQNRREGPIVRFSEDGFWEGLKRHTFIIEGIDHSVELNIKSPTAAPVTPFQESKIMSDPNLRRQFEQASILLEQYKYGNADVKDIFDLDRIAKYYAICDALSAYHGIAWHNQRFYFNPVTSKLEPIGYDGFDQDIITKNYFMGNGALNTNRAQNPDIENLFFLDVGFTKLYTHYLYQYTDRAFLQAFFAEIEEELSIREAFLQTEFEEYSFNREQIFTNAGRFHSMVLPYSDYSLRAYQQEKVNGKQILQIANFHNLPVQLIGSGQKAKQMTDSLDKPVVFEAFRSRDIYDRRALDTTAFELNYWDGYFSQYNQQPIRYQQLSINSRHKYLFFKPLGIDSVFTTRINPWRLNDKITKRQEIFKDINLQSNQIYRVSEHMIYFTAGKHTIREAIIIPQGYDVIFEPGVELNYINRAKFLSRSPVQMRGTESAPIRIYSSDGSAQGFTILESPQESQLQYVEFDRFNTLSEDGWTLTGAVTFYEADVTIDHCIFKNNGCEDGLNIIRSNFLFQNSMITNTFSDGLDADFCKGHIENVNFSNTGNDGMDFSGSVITITNTRVDNAGDKGVSVGEDSDANVNSIIIENSNIGVAAKDLSTLIIHDIEMRNCKLGFTAYQKKPEYGGAHIIVNKYKVSDIPRLHNIQQDCTLQLLDKMIRGEELNF